MNAKEYQKKLYNRINDNKEWPHFQKSDFLGILNSFADKIYLKKTTEGYLAALLIYHQLCEEMIKILIECSSFFVQCAIFPNEIKATDLKKKMFGELIKELKRGSTDKEIEIFIKKCENINSLRIRIVHKITLKTSMEDILRQSRQAKKYFDEISKIFNEIYDKYMISFHNFKFNSEDWLESIK